MGRGNANAAAGRCRANPFPARRAENPCPRAGHGCRVGVRYGGRSVSYRLVPAGRAEAGLQIPQPTTERHNQRDRRGLDSPRAPRVCGGTDRQPWTSRPSAATLTDTPQLPRSAEVGRDRDIPQRTVIRDAPTDPMIGCWINGGSHGAARAIDRRRYVVVEAVERGEDCDGRCPRGRSDVGVTGAELDVLARSGRGWGCAEAQAVAPAEVCAVHEPAASCDG